MFLTTRVANSLESHVSFRGRSSYERAKDFVAKMFKATKSSAHRSSILKGVMFVGVTTTIHRYGHLMSV